MRHWLFKSEPTTFSIDALKVCPKRTTCWDGVRNYQARNMLRDDIHAGDLAFFYHSNCTPPGIVGIMEIVSAGYIDHTAHDPYSDHYDPTSTAENPRWFMVDVKFSKKFKKIIALDDLKTYPALSNMQVARKGNRLSITPVTPEEWQQILKIAAHDEV